MRQSATIDPAEGEEGSSLASTAATTDKTATAGMSVTAAATIVADESSARAAAANGKPDSLEYIEQATDGSDKFEQRGGQPGPI